MPNKCENPRKSAISGNWHGSCYYPDKLGNGPTTTGQVSGIKTMTNTANNFRSAIVAVSFAFLGSVLLLAGTVSAPLVA